MKDTRAGLGYGIGAYLIWGGFPLFFTLIAVVNPFEVVSWRVVTTLLVCAVIVTVTRRWRRIGEVLKQPKTFGLFALSSILLYANWQIFVIGVISGHVLETSLGYFINPLFTILFGVIFWREKLSRLQWIAVVVAGTGVLFSAISYGRVPWIALGLALSFGLYGVVHQRIEDVDGVTGLTVETLVSVPIGLAQLAIVGSVAGLTAFSHGGVTTALVLVSGLLTAIPLILFGEAARRLPLTYVGFLQFLTPVLGFLFGYFIMHEELPIERWVGFIAVWIALMFLIADMIVRLRRSPSADLAHQPHTGPIPLD
ncbi:EamA family transporter RarD [Leucobacter aridicollis]|uniref:Chloramphenicol-sensitive protein RarD n=1 Tax=Leucobacter aridicollis TaxID=283878 RepID=A0A852R3T2_9MICO|nr:EamA family transporter RarD [Leucobacter aridicollis]MBL3682777.1 EamA family transporter RarD [Leucobacter aridicollis]MCS3426918.1 chloramphenicol-sensitive protein RarD [Leucobacter aridicollis]NYD26215.1 chloramphenicol-sensitive protein RarD [Leucobacter aridicollis]